MGGGEVATWPGSSRVRRWSGCLGTALGWGEGQGPKGEAGLVEDTLGTSLRVVRVSFALG